MGEEMLPHLKEEMIVGARNSNLCSYLISLEAWRRGLKVTFTSEKVKKKGLHSPGRAFLLSNGERTHAFYKAKGDKVSDQAIAIGINKHKTKEWLENAAIPVPKGKSFSEESTVQEMVTYFEKLKYPVVVKPRRGAQGRGVIANISDSETLRKAIVHLRENLKVKDIIIERYIKGVEHRFYVIEDEVIAILKRIPANVIGDGMHTIEELIKMKNKDREKNPRLYSSLIKIDYELKRVLSHSKHTLESIPEDGKQILLRENSNVSTGGDSIDVTKDMPEEIKQIAVDTLKALPSLPHAGVDIIVNKEELEAVVLEINPIPQIGSMVFPAQGKARDIASAIVDYYFPETKNNQNYNPNIYFDFLSVLRPLINKTAEEVVVLPAPTHEMTAIQYTFVTNRETSRTLRRLRKRALEMDLFGFSENTKRGNIKVIVAGEGINVQEFEKECVKVGGENITKKEWTRPIKIGFNIRVRKFKKKKPKVQQSNATKKKQISMTRRIIRKIKQKIKK